MQLWSPQVLTAGVGPGSNSGMYIFNAAETFPKGCALSSLRHRTLLGSAPERVKAERRGRDLD